MTRLLAVVSGKGGVGKTTVSVNLGSAFSTLSHDVVVVDADLTTPNVGPHIGTYKYDATLHDVLLGNAEVNDAVFFHHASGLKFIPGHMSMHVASAVHPDSLKELRHVVDGIAPVALIDSSSGMSKETQAVLHTAHDVLLTTTPDMPSILDTLKVLHAARENGCMVRGVVVNRVRGLQHELTLQEVSALLETRVVGVVPEDEAVLESLRLGQPVVVSHPQSNAARAFQELARHLTG